MAKTKPEKLKKVKKGSKDKVGKVKKTTDATLIALEQLVEFGKRNMITYATAVNMDRSIPDLYDGMKPVQRRILWAASQVAKASSEAVKTARVVGDVLGKYHPHGDTGTGAAIVTMVQSPTPPMYGKGGWGTLVDPAAAMRYTNCKLSDYGATFFNPDYINKEVTTFVPNYDDRDVEPVTLPALLPNVIINGVDTGIGVGVTTCIPSFTHDSVAEVLIKMLEGEKLDAKDYAKILVPKLKWGGRLVKSKDNRAAYLKLFKENTGAVQYTADLAIDSDRRTIIIKEWPAGLTPEKFADKVRKLPECQDVECTGGTTEYTVTAKKGYNLTQFESFAKKVQKIAIVKRSYRINVTHRKAEIKDGVVSFDTKFMSLSIPELLKKWLQLRLELEVLSLNYRIKKQNEAIAYTKLLMYAVSILDVIFKALKATDTLKFLVKNSKLNEEQARTILNMRVSQLSKLDDDAQKAKLKDQQAVLKQLEKWLKRPKAKVKADLVVLKAAKFWQYEPEESIRSRRKKKLNKESK